METYLAIINVKAEFEEKDGQPGYHVIYPDNHEGWIPLDLFEKQTQQNTLEDKFSFAEGMFSILFKKIINKLCFQKYEKDCFYFFEFPFFNINDISSGYGD